MVWIIIPVYNRKVFTERCLISLGKQTFKNFRILVFDDGSTDGTTEMLEQNFPEVSILRGDGNYWWSQAVNKGIKYALNHNAETIITLNDDLIIEKDYVEKFVDVAIKYSNSVIGSAAVSIKERDKIIYCGERMNWALAKSRLNKLSQISKDVDIIESDFLPGRGLLIPITVILKIGLFDEIRFPQSSADYDFVWRAKKAGFKVLCCINVKVYFYPEETGLIKFKARKSIRNLLGYLFSRKSSANILVRVKFFKKHCPLYLLFTTILIDIARVFFSYWKPIKYKNEI